jgi:hypothetical protein
MYNQIKIIYRYKKIKATQSDVTFSEYHLYLNITNRRTDRHTQTVYRQMTQASSAFPESRQWLVPVQDPPPVLAALEKLVSLLPSWMKLGLQENLQHLSI